MSSAGRTTRRDLLRTTARALCAAALAAGAALLALRNGRAACGERVACGGCGQRSRCELAAKPEPQPR